MNVVDSSAWLEYFADGPNATFFARAIESTDRLIVPTITIAEVFKRMFQQQGRDSAYAAVAQMRMGRVVDLDRKIAVAAARVGIKKKLAMADSIVFATAEEFGAILWTQDADFQLIDGVRYRKKQ